MTVVIVFIISLAVVFFFSANKANTEQKEHIQNSGGILVTYDTFINKLREVGVHSKIHIVNKTTFVVHGWLGTDNRTTLHVQYVFGKTLVAWFYPLHNGGMDKIVKEFDEGTDQKDMARWAISEYVSLLERLKLSI